MGRGGPASQKGPHPVHKPDQNIPVLTPGPSLISVPLLKGPSKKTAQTKVADPFAITPLQFPITPQQFPITPPLFPIAPRLHLHFLISSELITKNYTYTYTFQFFRIRGVMQPTSRVILTHATRAPTEQTSMRTK